MKPAIRASFRLNLDYQVRSLVEADVDGEYVSWLNDPETARYLFFQAGTVTVENQKHYVRRIVESTNDAIFGLFDSNGRLTGTSGVQKLNASEGGPWMGLLIGPRECRRHGLGTALVWIVTFILFSHFESSKIYAGMDISNVGSYKAYLKAGFRIDSYTESKSYPSSEVNGTQKVTVCCSPPELVASDSLAIENINISPA